MHHVSKNKHWSRMIGLVQWCCGWNHDTWTKADHRSVILWKYRMGSGLECAWAWWPSVVYLSFARCHRSTSPVQLSVFNLLSNSDDLSLRTVVVCRTPPPTLCFACAWINRCLQERGERATGVCEFVCVCLRVCAHMMLVCVSAVSR